MVANYNDIVRKQLTNYLKNNAEENIIDFLYSLKYDEQVKIIKLALADYYKLNFYLYKEKPEIFNFSIDRIIDDAIVDGGLMIDFIKAIKYFDDLDYVSKCLIIEEIETNNQDNNIFSFYKLHALDKLTYRIIDDIEYYKKYYKDYLDKNEDKPKRIGTITEFLTYKILWIGHDDFDKYKRYLLECIKVYYKWKMFVKNHDGEYLLNEEDLEYLEKINNNTISELIEELSCNSKFLTTIVGDYFYYKTQKIEIKEEMVDNYFEISSSNELKQKLKLIK